ncbi:MAG TPA: potassium channel family protein [Propionibacteriaceae bacterium]|nr:potassium channel family protein [Propionibacteriaceae bacterium]
MTESAGQKSDTARAARSRRFRRVVATLLRALGSTVGLVAIYYLLPLDRTSIPLAVGMLAVGLLALAGLVAFQVRSILRATFPALRAVGALATSVPLFLLLFAGTYYVMGGISEANFSEPLTRTDALYFTVTVFATVGFGDIVATTEGARVVVMGQMVAGIVIIGLGARIIVDAVKRGQQRQPEPASDATSEADSPLE